MIENPQIPRPIKEGILTKKQNMAAELIEIHPDNPQANKIKKVVDCLSSGGIIIYPTDTVYGMGCDILNAKAVDQLCRINKMDPRKIQFSFVCHNLSHISEYTKQIPSHVFKAMKKALPGPYTFILKAGNQVPRLLHARKSTVGIRVPDNKIILSIVEQLGNPILNSSIKDEDEIVKFTTDPEEIYERYKNQVDMVIHGGFGGNVPSTVIDCTDDQLTVIREGAGTLDIL